MEYMNYDNDENNLSPVLLPMSRLPQDIKIKGNNQISRNAQRRLRREYGIDFRGKTISKTNRHEFKRRDKKL